jgi:fluoroquinolone transport system permease protein
MKALLFADLRIQLRGGFWAVYAVVCVLLVGLLHALPGKLGREVLPVALLLDPAILGLSLAGVLVLRERQEGVLRALGSTPVGAGVWLGAKVLSLGLLALAATSAVSLGLGVKPRPEAFVPGVLGISTLCILLGIVVACRTRTTTQLLLGIQAVTLPLAIPFGEVLLGWEGEWLRWTPTGASLELLRGAAGAALSPTELVRDWLVLAATVALVWSWALSWTRRFLLGRVLGATR